LEAGVPGGVLFPARAPRLTRFGGVIIYAVVDDALSPDFPLGDAFETFVRTRVERRGRRPAGQMRRSR